MITFYDIASKVGAWSPNTFKTRISLNFKGIPFRTEWVEYPDIEFVLKKIGGSPTGKKDDGNDFYTLPAIHDEKTNKTIVDSEAIALYLDETYPETPKLFPPGSHAAISMHHAYLRETVPVWKIAIPAIINILNPRSDEYYRRTREERFGRKLEELAPPGPTRDKVWAQVKEGMGRVARIYEKNGEGNLFFFGETFSYADAMIVGYLLWLRATLGAENEGWKAVSSRSGGRWEKLLIATRKWHTVVM